MQKGVVEIFDKNVIGDVTRINIYILLLHFVLYNCITSAGLFILCNNIIYVRNQSSLWININVFEIK